MNWIEWLPKSETFCSVDLECKDCPTTTAACSVHIPDPSFRLLPEPIKERSLLSRETQQRQPPLPMRLPPDFKALHHRSLPHPDLQRYEATLQIPETTFLPMRASLDPFSYKGVHLRDMIKLFSAFQQL
jgi:hypothetical protein